MSREEAQRMLLFITSTSSVFDLKFLLCSGPMLTDNWEMQRIWQQESEPWPPLNWSSARFCRLTCAVPACGCCLWDPFDSSHSLSLARRRGSLSRCGRGWRERRMRGYRSRRAGEPRRVTGHEVNFEIEFRADINGAPVRGLECVRNEQNVEDAALDAVDGERGAVERDRALFGDKAHEVLWRLDRDAAHALKILDRGDLGDAVDMAGDNVAAKLITKL